VAKIVELGLMVQLAVKKKEGLKVDSSAAASRGPFSLCEFKWEEMHMFKIGGASAVCGEDDASWVQWV